MIGIDIGSTGVRAAYARPGNSGAQIHCVAAREFGGRQTIETADIAHLAAIVEDTVRELKTRERRCVCAVGEPDAILRAARFPNMRQGERERAARFEAAKHAGDAEHSVVRIHAAAAGGWTLGIARPESVKTRARVLREAGLRPAAVDHESYAFLRAFPQFDAVLDVGEQRSCLHVRTATVPLTYLAQTGGSQITAGIERDIGLDRRTAEKRKRILGTAGAGESSREHLVAELSTLLRRLSRPGHVALTGNGARLCGLAEDLNRSCASQVEVAVPPSLRDPYYPPDVAAAAAPEWALACGLALWFTAA
ncbi:MAG TPA: pilus assembly protein PilM [Candidatus Baltobacteraceae bacterium]|nr:pilus assembly protein PilM [Candidatus Baltobacteraceae bacterium]